MSANFGLRTLAALSLFGTALEETIDEVRTDAGKDTEYANAVALYLALFFDRLVQTNNALVRWFVHAERPSKAQPTFDKQTVQMTWDFAEANPLGLVLDRPQGFIAAHGKLALLQLHPLKLTRCSRATVTSFA